MGQSVKSMGDLQKPPPGATAAVNVATMGTRLDMDLPFELRALEICLDEVGAMGSVGTETHLLCSHLMGSVGTETRLMGNPSHSSACLKIIDLCLC